MSIEQELSEDIPNVLVKLEPVQLKEEGEDDYEDLNESNEEDLITIVKEELDADIKGEVIEDIIGYLPEIEDSSDYEEGDDTRPKLPSFEKIFLVDNNVLKSKDASDDITIVPPKNYGPGKKRTRAKNFCIFCECPVLNFARHVVRSHKNEPDVQAIMSKPTGSKDHKRLLTLLRNRGNFVGNSKICVKPMKMPSRNYKSEDYLPCSRCLGFYSRKQLWKHRKKCLEKDKNDLSEKRSHQAEGQSLLFARREYDSCLKENVFPRMRPDKISFVVKSDVLICAFGASCLRGQKTDNKIVNTTSRKMRQMSKLLIQLRILSYSIKDLFSALHPRYYALIVEATKLVARFDREKNSFEAPSYVVNVGSSLKQCCHIAIDFVRQKKIVIPDDRFSDQIESYLKTLIDLFESDWKDDVLYLASDELRFKTRQKKITLAPRVDIIENTKDESDFAESESIRDRYKEIEIFKEPIKKQRRILVRWTEEEKSAVINFFQCHIRGQIAPKKRECMEVISLHPDILGKKPWLKIKVFVQNMYTKKRCNSFDNCL